VAALPGVLSVGLVNRLPLAGGQQSGSLVFEGSALPPASVDLDFRTATPDYFQTLGIPLIEGRLFQSSDTSDHPVVGIIDQKLAQRMWPNQSALGRRFRFAAEGNPWMEIVGVVGHIRNDGLGLDLRPQVYWSHQQRPQARMVLAVRTGNEPALLTASVIKAIREIDPEQPVYDVRSMEEVVERSLSSQWLNMTVLSLFASVALVLATVGIYGVLSYSVGLRAREIGIRMALGSQRRDVIRMVLRQATFLAGLGTLIGIVVSLLLGSVLSTLLYEIKPTDVRSFLLAALTLLVVAFAASFIPARRAASVDPLSVLKSE
jgi:putative ABC transport system permease protein